LGNYYTFACEKLLYLITRSSTSNDVLTTYYYMLAHFSVDVAAARWEKLD